jgi:hypothetical protein
MGSHFFALFVNRQSHAIHDPAPSGISTRHIGQMWRLFVQGFYRRFLLDAIPPQFLGNNGEVNSSMKPCDSNNMGNRYHR